MHPSTAIQLAQLQHQERLAEAALRRSRIAQARARKRHARTAEAESQQQQSRCPDCGQFPCTCSAGPPALSQERELAHLPG